MCPADDGWITSAKLIQTVLGIFGVQVSTGEIYPHLKPPEENPELVYAKLRIWGMWHNSILARTEAEAKARDEATASAIARMTKGE